MTKKPKAVVGRLVRVCAGGRHAWFESDVGLIRKPYTSKNAKKERKEA